MKFDKSIVSPSFCISWRARITPGEQNSKLEWWEDFKMIIILQIRDCQRQTLPMQNLWILCYESLNIHLYELLKWEKVAENPGHFNHPTFTIGCHFFRAGAILPGIHLQLQVSSTKVRDKCLLMNVWMWVWG